MVENVENNSDFEGLLLLNKLTNWPQFGLILKSRLSSLKWAQVEVCSSIRLGDMSIWSEPIQYEMTKKGCYNNPEKNGNLEKWAKGMISLFFAMDYAWTEPLETAEKVAVLLV